LGKDKKNAMLSKKEAHEKMKIEKKQKIMKGRR